MLCRVCGDTLEWLGSDFHVDPFGEQEIVVQNWFYCEGCETKTSLKQVFKCEDITSTYPYL